MGKTPNSSSSRKLKGGAEVPLGTKTKIATDVHLGVTSSEHPHSLELAFNFPPYIHT